MKIIIAFFTLINVFSSHVLAKGSVGCGYLKPSERVIGGVDAKRRAWPWLVNLSYLGPIDEKNSTESSHICGGTLIHMQWVLTAAHCLDVPRQPNVFPKSVPVQWRVTAGMFNRSEEEKKEGNWQTSRVKRFIYHENFTDFFMYTENDIALLQLKRPFKRTEYVKPICLPSKSTTLISNYKERCYIAGWGTLEENSRTYSQTLQEVPIYTIKQNYCQIAFKTQARYQTDQHICGGDWINGNKDSCKGDSGGPLACRGTNGRWYVEGIISWGIGCGKPQSPGVYTNVRQYRKWIATSLSKFISTKTTTSKPPTRSKRNTKSSADAFIHDSMIHSTKHLLASERKAIWKKFQLSRKRRAAQSQ